MMKVWLAVQISRLRRATSSIGISILSLVSVFDGKLPNLISGIVKSADLMANVFNIIVTMLIAFIKKN